MIRGNPIHLVCNVSGGHSHPPRDVFWYKDGHLLDPDPSAGRIITSKMETTTLVSVLVSVLVIRRSTVSHAGQYYCRSTNNQLDHITVRVLTGKKLHVYKVYAIKLRPILQVCLELELALFSVHKCLNFCYQYERQMAIFSVSLNNYFE